MIASREEIKKAIDQLNDTQLEQVAALLNTLRAPDKNKGDVQLLALAVRNRGYTDQVRLRALTATH